MFTYTSSIYVKVCIINNLYLRPFAWYPSLFFSCHDTCSSWSKSFFWHLILNMDSVRKLHVQLITPATEINGKWISTNKIRNKQDSIIQYKWMALEKQDSIIQDKWMALESDFLSKVSCLLADSSWQVVYYTLVSNCCIGYTTNYCMTKHTMAHKR